jgi:glucose-6-phosphate isomerase
MESVGKQLNLAGEVVEQGLAVYGNKGSTDQHAFVQQLVAGRRDSFATFIVALSEPSGQSRDESGNTPGEHLLALMLGTRRTLSRSGRHSATIVLQDLTPASLGGLIALFERAVGAFSAMVEINAYDQPGVEAGKLAAELFLRAMRGEAVEIDPSDQALIDLFSRSN